MSCPWKFNAGPKPSATQVAQSLKFAVPLWEMGDQTTPAEDDAERAKPAKKRSA